MNHSQRFRAIFNGEGVDRIPLYFFGTWRETKIRWKKEGLDTISTFNGDAGPQVPGMDPDWEEGMWDCHGLVNVNPIGNLEHKVIQETEDHVIYRNSIGDIVMDSKKGSTVAHIIEHGLKPTRESWKAFKEFLDPDEPARWGENWEKKAEELLKSGRVLAFMGGSMYGWLRKLTRFRLTGRRVITRLILVTCPIIFDCHSKFCPALRRCIMELSFGRARTIKKKVMSSVLIPYVRKSAYTGSTVYFCRRMSGNHCIMYPGMIHKQG